MYKRALMLTAATVGLLSGAGHAVADTTITKKTTDQLATSTSGNITITTTTGTGASTGSVEIPSSSTTPTAPAILIDSSNSLSLTTGTLVSFNDTADAVGITANTAGLTGSIVNGGTISLTGTGTDKTGILIGAVSGTIGTFTGVVDTTDNTYFPADLTAVALQSGSVLTVEGDGSYGIRLTTADTLLGDILVDGALRANATNTTAVPTASGAVTGIELDGTLGSAATPSSLVIGTSGTVIANGAGAQGVVVLGQINGSILNEGSIETVVQANATKSANTTAKTTGNAEAGSALVISNNITGGVYNSGPGNGDTTTAPAVINASSTSAALVITPGFSSTTPAPLIIGGYTDPLSIFGQVSLLNRGTITGVPTNVDSAAAAVTIAGLSSADPVTLSNGIVNSGSINALARTDDKSTTVTSAVALSIGDYVAVGGNSGTQSGFGGGFALVNSDERSGSGTITASVAGASSGVAEAIVIGAPGASNSGTGTTLTSLFNSGIISASATSTDTTVSSLGASAIYDYSGTLTNIVNSGTISAGVTTLDNKSQLAQALDLSAATTATTITNTGTIVGDVFLGSGQDTITVSGTPAAPSTLTGNIYYGGSANNVLTIDGGGQVIGKSAGAVVTGNILETVGGRVAITVQNGGTLNVTNNGYAENGTLLQSSTGALTTGAEPGLLVSTLTVTNGSTLGLSLAQPFNLNVLENDGPVVKSTGAININSGAIVNLSFGSFVSASVANPAQFVVFDAPTGQLTIADGASIKASVDSNVPFLFDGSLCTVNAPTNGIAACATPPQTTTDSQLALQLTPKTSAEIGLTGYAAKMFTYANTALSNDNALGAAVIAAGSGLTGTAAQIAAAGQKIYQGIYSAFAPDVTGADRALAISITDQSSGPVGARQRALRMYAGQDGEATIWGQEFTQRLNIGNTIAAGGYSNTGFGFVFGADSGDPHDGRYGGAFTFYSGNTSEKAPRTSKTSSDWYMATGYSDWRGKGLFLDTQLSAGYGQITGKRSLVINDVVQTTADGKRGAALLAGGLTTGVIYNTGGTVFIPQISLDGLTMREEGYTESNSSVVTQATNGFDLHVKPYYANSARAFVGADLRQDLKFSDLFLQPELRAGYRYDFIDGAQKLRAEFACSTVAAGGCGQTAFTITGPDPSRGNLVLGGGVAVTTGAWSVGLNYDYLHGFGGTKGEDQTATISLLGRI